MSAKAKDKNATADREIVTTRVINAPRDLVWKAWASVGHLSQWWGPNGFTTTTSAFDFRAGGVWRFVMHGPDGRDYQNRIRYTEIVERERIVIEHDDGSDVPKISFHNTVTFTESGGKTTVTMRAVLPTAAERDRVIKDHGAVEGGQQTLARLDAFVAASASSAAGSEVFEITRALDAPRDAVWKAWSEAKALEHWWGPKGCKLQVISLDFCPGGMFHYAMNYSTGAVMWGRFFYREISPPERIVWLNAFATENGGIARAPFSTVCPLEILNTVTLTEANGKTTLHLKSVAHGANAEEQAFFRSLFGGMQQGFGGTFDQLDDYLKADA
jgi:uncharacterized protein YndB with AHSA1/START domain